MFFKDKEEDSKQTVIITLCSCGTHSINLSYFDDDTQEYYLSFFVDSFYVQDGLFKTICKRIKKAFQILCGKSYRFEEIVLSRKDLEKLNKEINTILEKGKEKNNE